jgi:ubiquinone/menaquinone biosynthesis C-methylase UbiE
MKEAVKIMIDMWNKRGRDWERYYVPIFKPFAKTVVDRAHIKLGYRVLDVGTGTGLAAFLASSRVGESGSVVGIDIAEGMLNLAIQKSKRLRTGNLSFEVMDASNLKFPSESFEIVISNLGIPLYEKKAFSKIHKVMKNGVGYPLTFGAPKKQKSSKPSKECSQSMKCYIHHLVWRNSERPPAC